MVKKQKVDTQPQAPSLIDDDFEDEQVGDDNDDDDDEEEEEMEVDAKDAEEEDASGDPRFRDPTAEEVKGLNEAELLFKSSLLRLQISELKSEVSVDFAKLSGLEDWLHSLKDKLEALPRATLQAKKLKDSVATTFESFEFHPPSNIHMIGSYLLRTLIKPDLTVDVAVEIPESSLHQKDWLNHRYRHKRMMYLNQIAAAVKGWDNLESISFTRFRGDPMKPMLILKPAGLKGLSAKFKIRLSACLPKDYFQLQRFRPTRNNVRVDGVEDIGLQPPTPSYNNSIAEDQQLVHHLELLHASIGETPALQEAVMLLKVWLRQRQLSLSADSMNGFLMSMLVLYLLQQKSINNKMSSYQILRLVFVFLSQRENLERGIALKPAAAGTDPAEAIQEFKNSAPAVFLDDSLAFNLFARMTESALSELSHEACIALRCLDKEAHNGFSPLMLQSVAPENKFDEFIVMQWGPEDEEELSAERPGGGKWEKDKMFYIEADPTLASREALRRQAISVAQKALGDRIYFARAFLMNSSGKPGEEETFDTMREAVGASDGELGGRGKGVLIGLLLNPENATRKIDKGPLADDAETAKEFRQFWGNKSELRRFKDGVITETLVWSQTAEPGSKFETCAQVARFALRRHLKPSATKIGSGVGAMHIFLNTTCESFGEAKAEVGEEPIDPFNTLELLRKTVMDLNADQLPLRVMALQPLTPAVRGLSAGKLTPHPLAFRDVMGLGHSDASTGKRNRGAKGTKGSKGCSLCIESIDCAMTLQNSGKWPDDITALRQLTTALYLRMAECLNESQGPFIAKATPDHLLVLAQGYAFRLIVWNEREVKLLQFDGKKPEAQKLEKHLFHKPQHTAAVIAVSQKYPSMSDAVRLSKKWVSVHLLSKMLTDEAVELMVAHCYLTSLPFAPPSTPLVGFLRFLRLLATFDWKSGPLVIDLSPDREPVTDEIYRECMDKADLSRGVPLRLCTVMDRSGDRWVRGSELSTPGLRRAIALAKKSQGILGQGVALGSPAKVRSVMKRVTGDYDALMWLHSGAHLQKSSNILAGGAFKNLRQQEQANLLVGLCPIGNLMQELRTRYGKYAVFWADEVQGDCIAVLWKPAAVGDMPLTVTNSTGSYPLLSEGADGLEAKDGKVVLDMVGLLVSFKELGKGLIKQVEVIPGARRMA